MRDHTEACTSSSRVLPPTFSPPSMSLHLSGADLARVETASRVMVSPLVSSSVDAWRSDVNAAMRELFRAHKTVFMLPEMKGSDIYYSDDADDVVQVMKSSVEVAASGDHIVHDPVVALWHTMRRRQRVDVFSWSINAEMIGQHGYRMEDSEFTRQSVVETGSSDFVGIYSNIPGGEVLLWSMLERSDSNPFGEHAPMLLRALLPSFNAGLDALVRFNHHRETLDAVSEPLIVYGAGMVERHRNPAFEILLSAEPDRPKIMMAVLRLVTSLQPFGFPIPSHASSPVSAPQSTVSTAAAAYDLRATILGPSAFDPDGSVMVSLHRRAAPALPSRDALRERFGLTDRESEVSLLLAEGLSNTEIADRLFLSPHTARRHTANIFDKIGVSSEKRWHCVFWSPDGLHRRMMHCIDRLTPPAATVHV